jgi:hypothetical protein
VCGTDNTVYCGLLGVEIGTALLVRISVSVLNHRYGNQWVCGIVDRNRGVSED